MAQDRSEWSVMSRTEPNLWYRPKPGWVEPGVLIREKRGTPRRYAEIRTVSGDHVQIRVKMWEGTAPEQDLVVLPMVLLAEWKLAPVMKRTPFVRKNHLTNLEIILTGSSQYWVSGQILGDLHALYQKAGTLTDAQLYDALHLLSLRDHTDLSDQAQTLLDVELLYLPPGD